MGTDAAPINSANETKSGLITKSGDLKWILTGITLGVMPSLDHTAIARN